MKTPIHPVVTIPQEPFLQWPLFSQTEEAAVLQILRDGNVSTHPVIRELEKDFCQFTGRQFALAHCNGTAALLAAFHAIGLSPGDEVLVPSATFWASALPMLWCGLVPVFCESEQDTLGIDPADAARRITPRTRAIVIVHLWGLPCKVEEIQRLAALHGLKIVEDASHAHGASAEGIPCGRFGDVSVFSMQGDKLVPAGEGGVLLTDDEEIYTRAVCLGDITRIIELQGPERRFAATSFGIKTRIAPMSAALGRAMLARLPQTNAVRNHNHQMLSEALEPMGFDCFLAPANVERVYFEFIIRHRDPGMNMAYLVETLQQMGCRVGMPRYPLLHQQPFFTEGHWQAVGRYPAGTATHGASLPRTEEANGQLIRLPNFTHPQSEPLIEQYAEAFRQAISML
ncbi:MAG: DegT/DnrJ/EryC1/StrS family aminotransferase [Azoarcus sp.]|jgi:dTDP-4-amino-4,6-dideoxygalactose transaminase|nr:DegT/DnrJ/EryC1/StrS family aminotransferase [Azoarcus sp.]